MVILGEFIMESLEHKGTYTNLHQQVDNRQVDLFYSEMQ